MAQKLSLNQKRIGVAVLAAIVVTFLAVAPEMVETAGEQLALVGIGVGLAAMSMPVAATVAIGGSIALTGMDLWSMLP